MKILEEEHSGKCFSGRCVFARCKDALFALVLFTLLFHLIYGWLLNLKAIHLVTLQLPANMLHYVLFICIIITCWIWYCPCRQSWPDFVRSLSLLRPAHLFDHKHLLSPVHFSYLILYLLFPRLFWCSSSSTIALFKFQSLRYHIFIFFPQNMTIPRILHLLQPSFLDSFMPYMSINYMYHHVAIAVLPILALCWGMINCGQ